ncbi:MAG: LysR substrate-binding domain-containing protein [Cyanobacteria bacterium J06649_4]
MSAALGRLRSLFDDELFVRIGRTMQPTRKATAIAPEIHVIIDGIARKEHPAIEAGGMSLETFAGLSHVLNTIRRDATGYGDTILARYGLARRIEGTTPHMVVVPSMVAASDLVAMVPSRVASGHCDQDKFNPFELPFEADPWSISMLWSRLATADPLNQWLRETLKSLFVSL